MAGPRVGGPSKAPSEGTVRAAGALVFLRDRRRARRTRQERLDRLYHVYLVLLLGGYAGIWAYPLLAGGVLLRGVQPALVLEATALWGPPALLLVLFEGLRYATWQGPVVFSRPDTRFLLSAPLDRAELVRGKLARGMSAGALVGAGLGLLLFALLQGVLDAEPLPLLLACLAGPGALGLLVAALGWHVERSAAVARWVLRYGALAWAVAGILVLGVYAGGPRFAEYVSPLSGPWGWALSPVVAAAGGRAPLWPAAAVALAAATAAAVATAFVRAGEVPMQELSRRAETRRGLSASVRAMDLRGAALLKRGLSKGIAGSGSRRLLPRPRSPFLAVPWRDALWLSRNAGRAVWAAALFGGAVLLALSAPTSYVAVLAAVLLAYLGAAQIVEPARVETDAQQAARRLPYRYGDLLLLHGAVPVLLLTLVGVPTTAVAFAAGPLPAVALPASLFACPLVAGVLVACATAAAQRSRTPPLELLVASSLAGDLGGLPILIWLATGPILASVALGFPALVLVGAMQGPAISAGVLAAASVYILAAFCISVGMLKRQGYPG